MPVNDLGLMRSGPPAARASKTVVFAPTTPTVRASGPRALRMIPFAACVGLAIWAFAVPVQAAETITTIDTEEQADQLRALSSLLGGAAVLNMTVPEFNIDETYISNVLNVFVRMFSTLILLASGGIPGCDLAGRTCAALAYATATGFMIGIVVDDNFDILTQWFSIAYLLVGCALPTVVTGVEAVTMMR